MIKLLLTTTCAIALFSQAVFGQPDSIKIDDEQKFAVMRIEPTAFNTWIANDEFSEYEKAAAVTTKIFRKFKDDFDFVILISNNENMPEGFPYYGKYIMVSNAVEGIGTGVYSNATFFGSSGKLKGVLHLPYKDGILYGPFLHELMHCWANNALPTEVAGHWGFMGGNVPAQLGGFLQSSLEKNVDGNPNLYRASMFGPIANGGNSVPYSEFELYMMGLIPLSEVKPFDVLTGIKNAKIDPADNSKVIFEAETCVKYTPEKISNMLGERKPASTQSQKNFTGLFVVITPDELTPIENNHYNAHIEEFCRPSTDNREGLYNFWEATSGLAVLKAENLNKSVIDTPTFIAENSEISELLIYPNPMVDELHVNSNFNIERIVIFNSANQQVVNRDVSGFNIVVPIRDLNSGIYFVNVSYKNKTETRKIIVK